RQHTLGSSPLESQQKITRNIRYAEGLQVGETTLDGFHPLPAPIVTGVDLGIECLDPEGQLLDPVSREDLQAFAVHDRGIEFEFALRAGVPRERPVERLEQLVKQFRRQYRRCAAADV